MQSRQNKLVWTLAAVLVLITASSACGQKGDLYLPDPESEKSEQAAAE